MGCGTSVEIQHGPDTAPINSNSPNKNNNTKTLIDQNGQIPVQNGRPNSGRRKTDKNKKNREIQRVLPPIPDHTSSHQSPDDVAKSVAFDVQLDNNIDKILSRHPPKRLKRLEPLAGAPVLSAEMLEEKLRVAEEKRKQQLEKKKMASRKSSSKMHDNLKRAQEFEKTQHVHQTVEMEEKQRSADRNREIKQRELEEKKRLREERGRLARERAKQIKQQENGLEFDVEKDENFNHEEGDSWLDDDNNRSRMDRTETPTDRMMSAGDRIYSGRESPHKVAGRPVQEFRGFSASTSDSHDFAFQRQQPQKPSENDDDFFDKDARTDDFFDS